MKVLRDLTSQTCHFILVTTFGNNPKDAVAQEWGSGGSGHLMRLNPSKGYDKYYKFFIYPDPDQEGKYRLINAGWPDHHIILESNRARLAKLTDSDLFRFEFKQAQYPGNDRDTSEQWNYLYGVGVKKHVDFASHRYVHPTSNPHDAAKLWFVPVDVQRPDQSKLKAAVPTHNDLTAPGDYLATNGEEWGRRVVSVEAIPAALIQDDRFRNKIDQAVMSPYYYLRHEQLWSTKNMGTTSLSRFQSTTDEKEYRYAFSKSDYESVERTVGHTFTASIELYEKRSLEAGVKEGGAGVTGKNESGANLKLAYQYQDQTKKIKQKSSKVDESFTEKLRIEYRQLGADEEEFYFRHWVPVDRYTLMNTASDVIGKWDYVGVKRHHSQKVRR